MIDQGTNIFNYLTNGGKKVYVRLCRFLNLTEALI